MSLRFSEFDLPKGASLFIWSADRIEYIGGFDHRNMKDWGGLATGLVAGDAVVVEVHVPAGKEDAVALHIDQVVHAYRDIAGKAALVAEALGEQRGPYGNSGDCNINVNCPEGATWQCEKRSVALILQGAFAICTGAMVNNTAQDGSPLFLTAGACLGNVGNWVFVFNHETEGCTGNTGPTQTRPSVARNSSSAAVPRTSGSCSSTRPHRPATMCSTPVGMAPTRRPCRTPRASTTPAGT